MNISEGHPSGVDVRAFMQEVEPRIHDKLEVEILAFNGIKFQLALKVQLRKDNPDGSEEYTDPVLRNKQEALLQASEIKGALKDGISHLLELLEPLGAARKVDTESVGVDGRPGTDPLAGHRKISAIERELLHPTSSSRKVQEGSCQCEKQG